MGERLPSLNKFIKKENQFKDNVIQFDQAQRILEKQKDNEERKEPTTYEIDKFIAHDIQSSLFNMCRLKDSLRNPTTMLFYLLYWSGHRNGGPNKTTKEWYKHGFIVAYQRISKIARDLQISERTANRWIKALVQDGLLVLEKDVNGKNVYVLGHVYKDGSEGFYYTGSALPYRRPEK